MGRIHTDTNHLRTAPLLSGTCQRHINLATADFAVANVCQLDIYSRKWRGVGVDNPPLSICLDDLLRREKEFCAPSVAYPWFAAVFWLTPKCWGLKKPDLIATLLGLIELRLGTGYELIAPAVVEVNPADWAVPS